MDTIVQMIVNNATEFTPEVIVRLMLFMMLIEGILGIARILGRVKI